MTKFVPQTKLFSHKGSVNGGTRVGNRSCQDDIGEKSFIRLYR